jgi:hypothetical protein
VVWTWIAGTLVLVAGVGLIYTGHPEADPIAAVGSFIILFSMLMFAWILYRRERTEPVKSPLTVLAE